jgi:hypothetical protein
VPANAVNNGHFWMSSRRHRGPEPYIVLCRSFQTSSWNVGLILSIRLVGPLVHNALVEESDPRHNGPLFSCLGIISAWSWLKGSIFPFTVVQCDACVFDEAPVVLFPCIYEAFDFFSSAIIDPAKRTKLRT